MSNLKFRAFHKIRKEMYRVHGWHSEFVFKDTLDGVGNDGNPDKLVDVELMQFTGLNDKNGNDIFEGDILFNSNRILITSSDDKRLYLVKWQEGEYNNEGTWLQKKPSFVFEKIITNSKKYMDLIFSKEQIEVIGNIYENPELLK